MKEFIKERMKYHQDLDKKTQGKKNRASGAAFELRVRKDLEKKGWIISKWMNNVEFVCNKCEAKKTRSENSGICDECGEKYLEGGKPKPPKGRLIPAKHKFRGPGIPMSIGTGFPDFISFKRSSQYYDKKKIKIEGPKKIYVVRGVEVKSNGYLDKTEKEKCVWLLDNNVFSTIYIASKGTKRGEIVYKEFK